MEGCIQWISRWGLPWVQRYSIFSLLTQTADHSTGSLDLETDEAWSVVSPLEDKSTL